jgi:hypothetical protein
MIREHGNAYFVFDDDNSILDKKHLFGILDMLDKKNLKISIYLRSRVDTVDDERLQNQGWRVQANIVWYGEWKSCNIKAHDKGSLLRNQVRSRTHQKNTILRPTVTLCWVILERPKRPCRRTVN